MVILPNLTNINKSANYPLLSISSAADIRHHCTSAACTWWTANHVCCIAHIGISIQRIEQTNQPIYQLCVLSDIDENDLILNRWKPEPSWTIQIPGMQKQ